MCTERVSDRHHHREADDLGARLEVAENAGVAHSVRLAALPSGDKPNFLLTLPTKLTPGSRAPGRWNRVSAEPN
jgi:hypothetical protein